MGWRRNGGEGVLFADNGLSPLWDDVSAAGSGCCQPSNDETCSHSESKEHLVQRDGRGGAEGMPVRWLRRSRLRVSLTRCRSLIVASMPHACGCLGVEL